MSKTFEQIDYRNAAYELERVNQQLVETEAENVHLKGILQFNRTEEISDSKSIESTHYYPGPVTRSRGAEAEASNLILLTELPVGTQLSCIPLIRSSSLQSVGISSRIKKRHICDSCDLTFAEASSLKAHLSTHKVEKLLHYDLCGKEFVKRGLYDAHMDKHNGIRYRCSICLKDYVSYESLGCHLKKFHPNKPHPPVRL